MAFQALRRVRILLEWDGVDISKDWGRQDKSKEQNERQIAHQRRRLPGWMVQMAEHPQHPTRIWVAGASAFCEVGVPFSVPEARSAASTNTVVRATANTNRATM